MNEIELADQDLAQFGSQLSDIAADFAEQLDGPPTLGELLEIIGLAASSQSEISPKFKVKMKGNRLYKSNRQSRVGELNDAIFADAMGLISTLLARINSQGDQLALCIMSAMKSSGIFLDDVELGDVRDLSMSRPKSAKKAGVGDIIAIPARGGGYHVAAVVARNRFGTALGLFDGVSTIPRVKKGAIVRRPVYTDERLIATGAWKVVDHDDRILDLFPREPEIFHEPTALPGMGKFGAGENASGVIRELGADEAVEIGLTDGTYVQILLAEQLQRSLDERIEMRGR